MRTILVYTVVHLVCLMLIAGTTYALVVEIPDPNLEAALRDALDIPSGSITDADLATLELLVAQDESIADLTGLEFCTSLGHLDLSSNQISDISPLAGLTNLGWLGLDNNNISDISAIADLRNLAILDLHSNQIGDISALAGLSNLRGLWIQQNSIGDISSLSALGNLRELWASVNQISDISPLASLTQLGWLSLPDNRISDISAVASLSNLSWLDLGVNQISDISAVINLSRLQLLYLNDNNITDLQVLVDSPGIGARDRVDVTTNPLSTTAIEIQIPILLSRGVDVRFDGVFSGVIELVDEQPAGTWNYQLRASGGKVSRWTYYGSGITGASVDGEALQMSWYVSAQTDKEVEFRMHGALLNGTVTGFHITGTTGGKGEWVVGSSSGVIDGPLPVALVSFTAHRSEQGIELKWLTASESHNLGFHVYRSKHQDGVYQRVTSVLIPGHGTDGQAHEYCWLDEGIKDNESYWYLIEDIALDGSAQRSHAIVSLDSRMKLSTMWGTLKRSHF